ncbi:MAG: hypothetical protein WCN98_13860 [Verrucomicrobiaceae bacterium]
MRVRLPSAQAVGAGVWSVLSGASLTQGNDGSVVFTDNVFPVAGARRFLRLSVDVP